MSISWRCPSCLRSDLNQESCSQCEAWTKDTPHFAGQLDQLQSSQASLHDTKGQQINTWPVYPVTVMQAQRERFFKKLRKKEGIVFEVGCHRSGVLHTFAEKNWQIRGIDVSREAVIDQSAYFPGSFAVSPAEEIPLPDNCVDLVLAIHVLEHVTDLQKTLKEINRVMKPGALLFVEVPLKDFGSCWEGKRFSKDPESWKKQAASVGHLWEKIPEYENFKQLLLDSDFSVIEEERGSMTVGPAVDNWLLTTMRNRKKNSTMSSDVLRSSVVDDQSSKAKRQEMVGHKKKIWSAFVRLIDHCEHKWVGSSKNGATALFLCRKK